MSIPNVDKTKFLENGIDFSQLHVYNNANKEVEDHIMEKPSTFANRLNTALEHRQITKAELARLSGLSKSSITRYAKGDWEAKQDAVYAIAQALNVNEAWLMGYDAPMERVYSELLASIAEDNKSGRTAAVEELRRTYGTEHSIHSTYGCDDKKRVTLLYYKTLERMSLCP